MNLVSGIVVQGQLYMYGYTIPLFHECYMRHGVRLTGVDSPTPLNDLQLHPVHAQLLRWI